MAITKVKRSKFMTFLNVQPGSTAKYALIGEGVTTGEIGYNAQTEEEIYIHQDSGVTDITAYKPTMPVEATATQGDEVFDFVDKLRMDRAVLGDAITDIVNVWLYQAEQSGSWPAEKQTVAVSIDSFGGEGGKPAKIKYTLNYQGDPVKGKFNPTTKTFEAG